MVCTTKVVAVKVPLTLKLSALEAVAANRAYDADIAFVVNEALVALAALVANEALAAVEAFVANEALAAVDAFNAKDELKAYDDEAANVANDAVEAFAA